MDNQNEMLMFYNKNKDFKRYIDECIKTYGKDLDYMLRTRIAESYYEYLIEEAKGKDENK